MRDPSCHAKQRLIRKLKGMTVDRRAFETATSMVKAMTITAKTRSGHVARYAHSSFVPSGYIDTTEESMLHVILEYVTRCHQPEDGIAMLLAAAEYLQARDG